MRNHTNVTVESIDKEYGFTVIEVCAPNEQPASFAVHYDSIDKKYHFSQSGENNFWQCFPDERK